MDLLRYKGKDQQKSACIKNIHACRKNRHTKSTYINTKDIKAVMQFILLTLKKHKYKLLKYVILKVEAHWFEIRWLFSYLGFYLFTYTSIFITAFGNVPIIKQQSFTIRNTGYIQKQSYSIAAVNAALELMLNHSPQSTVPAEVRMHT